MALNLKNRDVERLAAEVAAMARESKTDAIRRALEDRKRKLAFRVTRKDRLGGLRRFLETEVWPAIPAALLGKRLSKKRREAILGYGARGV